MAEPRLDPRSARDQAKVIWAPLAMTWMLKDATASRFCPLGCTKGGWALKQLSPYPGPNRAALQVMQKACIHLPPHVARAWDGQCSDSQGCILSTVAYGSSLQRNSVDTRKTKRILHIQVDRDLQDILLNGKGTV